MSRHFSHSNFSTADDDTLSSGHIQPSPELVIASSSGCHILINTADETPSSVTTSITFNNFRGNGLLEEAAGKLQTSCFGHGSNNQATLLSCFPIQSGIERERKRDRQRCSKVHSYKQTSKQTNTNTTATNKHE